MPALGAKTRAFPQRLHSRRHSPCRVRFRADTLATSLSLSYQFAPHPRRYRTTQHRSPCYKFIAITSQQASEQSSTSNGGATQAGSPESASENTPNVVLVVGQKRKRAVCFGPESLVTIFVDDSVSRGEFRVHEDLISGSEFFRCALHDHWMGAVTRAITLSDHLDDVAIYLGYIYTKDTVADFPSGAVQPLDDHGMQAFYSEVTRIYVLAEKLQDVSTKNAMTRMVYHFPKRVTVCVVAAETVNLIYDGTRDGNRMRRLFVEIWTTVGEDFISESYENLPKEFMRDRLCKFRGVDPFSKRKAKGNSYSE